MREIIEETVLYMLNYPSDYAVYGSALITYTEKGNILFLMSLSVHILYSTSFVFLIKYLNRVGVTDIGV
jgi:hypothetical protein